MHCFHWDIEVTKIIVGILFSLIGATIALFQVRIGNEKNKLEKFERRFKIYESFLNYLFIVMASQRPTDSESLEYFKATTSAKFLFGKKLARFLDEVYKKGTRLNLLAAQNASASLIQDNALQSPQVQATTREINSLMSWFSKQMENPEILFTRYLGFGR
jgi:hypothetical protein